MKAQSETFAKIFTRFNYRYDTRIVFDDFLTLTLCAFSQNPATGKSYDEDLYLQTIGKYKDDALRFEFPKLLACLTNEMTDRLDSNSGNDMLGEFYEQNLIRKNSGQFFTPWHICSFMARMPADSLEEKEPGRPLRILDPACGSGRMLLASNCVHGPGHGYYGIDIDEVCVKMTALNLFLNGMFRSGVLCANALVPEDFRISYRVSFLPFGVFRIAEKEKSGLWHLLKNSWNKPKEKEKQPPLEFEGKQVQPGNQLTIF